ncbi:MAG: ATP-binding protein [Planctomycetota bacterium]
MPRYRKRLIDPLIEDLLAELPALLLVGPRATGKTTTATRHAKTIVRLDQEAQAAAFRADPDSALSGLEEPVLLDEWQAVPGVLGAIKRAVDEDPRPGRYLITGSVRAELGSDTWPGTGRAVRLAMYGMTVREQQGQLDKRPFLDQIAAGQTPVLPASAPDLRAYIALALRGGFPQVALGRSETARHHWLDSYVEQILTRDTKQLGQVRDPERLRRYFEAYAPNSAGVPSDKTLYEAAGVNRKTAETYERLLGNLLVVENVPAWTSNRIKRLIRAPKRYVVDPALLAVALRLDVDGVLRDGDLLGRLLDTFVLAELRAELVVCATKPRLFHLRLEQGRHELDLVAELGGGRIIGMEIKASASVGPEDAKHLAWLREATGDRFCAGVVFHTGPGIYSVGDRLLAVPICALWGR